MSATSDHHASGAVAAIKQGFRVELRPTAEQRKRLAQHAGLSRVAENFCLELVKAAIDQRDAERTYGLAEDDLTPVPWSAFDLDREWTAVYPARFPWIKTEGLSTKVPKQACRMRAMGLKNWADSRAGRRKGPRVSFPAWRKRKHGARFKYDSASAYPRSARAVHLPNIGKVHALEDMSWLTERVTGGRARVIGSTVKEQAGRWWISFQVEIDRSEVNAKRTVALDAPTCGIDLGLKTFAVIAADDGTVTEIQAPRALKAAQRKLRRANKALARSQRNSANRAKAKMKAAAIHLKVANRRADFLHKTTTMLARTKRAIAVEDLNVAGMVKNRRLARSISDAGFGEFIRQLRYKTDWYGSKLWAADRWFPSSKTCSACGAVHSGLTLSDRVWLCSCGVTHDRDINAARNLLAAMHAATT